MQPKLFSIFFLCWCSFSLFAQEPTSAPVLVAPVLQNNIIAPYPAAALAAEIEGVVLLELFINETGVVTEATIKESAGFGFDEAALLAAKQFIFTPAKKNGVARTKVGRSFVYSPIMDRERLRRLAVKDLVDAFFDGSQDSLTDWLKHSNVLEPAFPEHEMESSSGQMDTSLL